MNIWSKLFTRNNLTKDDIKECINEIMKPIYQRDMGLNRDNSYGAVAFEQIENGWLLRYAKGPGHSFRVFYAESKIEAAEKLLATIVADKLMEENEVKKPMKPSPYATASQLSAQQMAAMQQLAKANVMNPSDYMNAVSISNGLLGSGIGSNQLGK